MKQKMKIMVALILVLSMVSPTYASSQLSDHWAYDTISRWHDEGLAVGFDGESVKPDASISRAEFFTLIYNVIATQSSVEVPFKDVKKGDWYENTVKFAYEAGLTAGYPDGSFKPDNRITREEAAIVVSKLLSLSQPNDLETLKGFNDYKDTEAWNQSALGAMVQKGLYTGYPDNTLRSNANLSQAEAVTLLDKVFGERYLKAGTYGGDSPEEMMTIKGNLTLNAGDINLQNMIVKGDIFITEHVGEGEIHMDNVLVEGDTIVKGGGENSVYFKDVSIQGALLVKKANNKIRIVASGKTKVKVTMVESGAILLEQALEGGGFETVEIPAEVVNGANIVLDGQFETVSVEAPSVEIEVSANSKIDQLLASEKAENLNVSGKGTITNAQINAPHTSLRANVGKLVSKDGIDVSLDPEKDKDKSTKPSNGGSSNSKPDKKDMWTLAWSDEFNGSEIDTSKWTYDIGNWIVDGNGSGVTSGWGNNEKEYYTNSPNNAYLEDGKLVIKALKEETTDAFGTYDYTSAKLLTRGLFSHTYGKYEIRAKLPVGKGLWPAIWMLPADDIYGGWAASGELDIMEGWGSRPETVAGTLHYGALWPNNKYSGHEYVFEKKDGVNDFHTYSIEWEPGEIRWYVDEELYQTQNNWTSRDGNDEKFAFPAPFDQDFYMILNLAVGGNFDGDPTEETVFPSTMEVDYVRVYDLTGRDYMTPVEPSTDAEPLPEDAKQADSEGNYISNSDFSEPIQDNPEAQLDFGDKWNFLHMAEFGGSASQTIDTIDGTHYAKVDISNGGSQNYSVQLIQLTTLGKGRYYEVSFDAKASNSRSIGMKMSAGAERGWTTYSDNYALDLSDSFKTYTQVFQMAADTDTAARLELNLGLNTNSVWVGNVHVKEVPPPTVDYDASKPPLPDGNGIYNGAFDKETIDRLAYWHLDSEGVNASYSVPESTRTLQVAINSETEASTDLVLSQKGIQLEKNTDYVLTLQAKADASRTIEVALADANGTLYTEPHLLTLTTDMSPLTFNFKMTQETDLASQLLISLGGDTANVYLDNISLKATSIDYSDIDVFPLTNGDFAEGLSGWDNYIHYDAVGTISAQEDQAQITIDGVGAETWGIQFYQGPFDFSNKVEYKVAFDVKSDVDRNLEIILDNPTYTRYLSETVSATSEYTHYEYTLKLQTADVVTLKFLLGKTDANVPTGTHTVWIDNVVCEVKDAPKDANLIIKNGTFETDVNQWTLYTQDGSDASIQAVNEELEVAFSAYGGWETWSTQVYQDIIKLESGKDYILSFDASATVNRQILFEMTNMAQNRVDLTSDMTHFTYQFTASDTIDNGKLNFLLGTNQVDASDFVAHSVFLDNIAIEEAPPAPPEPSTTIVTNGTFDTDSHGWNIYKSDGSDGETSVDSGVLNATFSNYAGWEKWSTQLYQENISLEAGKTYTLKFDAHSTVDRNIWLELNNLSQQTLSLTGETKTYTYTFTAGSTISDGKLNFLLGTENVVGEDFVPHSIIFDNITIEESGLEIPEAVITNGTFDTNTQGWLIFNSDGSDGVPTVDEGQLTIPFVNYAGWFKWSTQFYQENLILEAGKTYTLQFDASASVDRDIWLELNFLEPQTVSLTSDIQTFTYTFTAGATISDGKLNFLLGTDNVAGEDFVIHTIILDNVVISPVEPE